MRESNLQKIAYAGLLALALIAGLTLSIFGQQIDSSAYDFMFRLHQPPPWAPESVILAADEDSLRAFGGMLKARAAFAAALNRISAVHPRAVALDLILADTNDPAADKALETALSRTPRLVLPSLLTGNPPRWDDPLPRFRRWAAVVGEVHADPDKLDAITREIPLEKAAGHDRRWALALEAFRVSRGGGPIEESPDDLRVGGVVIPSPIAHDRILRVRYAPPSMGGIPRVSLMQLADDPRVIDRFRDKVVFAGVTAQAVGDRWMTPLSDSVNMPGIEIHANAFETIAHRLFLVDAPRWSVFLACGLLVASAGLAFAALDGWPAYLAALAIAVLSQVLPFFLFTKGIVFPYLPPTLTAALAIAAAAAWQTVVVRRRLGRSEASRARYSETMQFVTHEMKTPLTAIQGSSELIGRYALPEEKRRQMANMINAESKRLAQMIETFLNVERLSAGQMQLKREPFLAEEVLARCVDRVRPVAERKRIEIRLEPLPESGLEGDRELMEYAFYNLLTNAVKYSPPDTLVTVTGGSEHGRVRVSVIDQGVGIDPKDARRIFEKFYRTRDAERSGEKGTGIGLSIVEQIVVQHGGAITVASEVGKGSKFTVSLPCAS